MTKTEIIKKAIEYILTLPSGMKITMNDVIVHACPEEVGANGAN